MKEETARLSRCGNCPSCGHSNGDWETRCEKCGRRLSLLRPPARALAGTNAPADAHLARTSIRSEESEANRAHAKTTPRPPAFPEHLRQHLQDRVQRFRLRQENPTLALPFEEIPEPPSKIISFPGPAPVIEPQPPAPPTRRAREPRPNDAPAAPAPQPLLDFQTGVFPEPVWRLRPVAPLRLRLNGHLKDLRMIGGAMTLFLLGMTLIPFLGVRIVPHLVLLGGVVCGSLLLTLLYGLLFLWRAGVTPGMKAARLRLVNFDGKPASRQQRLWRLLGAVVSAGSFLMGFLWAVADEEKLYWHDHISKTYLTVADP